MAVFYNNNLFIGQVINVLSKQEATVKFLESTARKDLSRWQKVEDISNVSLEFVYRWDFNRLPVSKDMRLWKIDDIEDCFTAYDKKGTGKVFSNYRHRQREKKKKSN